MQLRDILANMTEQDLDDAALITRSSLHDPMFADMTYTELFISVLKGMAVVRQQSN